MTIISITYTFSFFFFSPIEEIFLQMYEKKESAQKI